MRGPSQDEAKSDRAGSEDPHEFGHCPFLIKHGIGRRRQYLSTSTCMQEMASGDKPVKRGISRPSQARQSPWPRHAVHTRSASMAKRASSCSPGACPRAQSRQPAVQLNTIPASAKFFPFLAAAHQRSAPQSARPSARCQPVFVLPGRDWPAKGLWITFEQAHQSAKRTQLAGQRGRFAPVHLGRQIQRTAQASGVLKSSFIAARKRSACASFRPPPLRRQRPP